MNIQTETHAQTTQTMPFTPRKVARKFTAIEQSEGVGARVRRAVGNMQVRNFSPFLLFDHFKVPSTAGFPDHPHRGQETITYVIDGSVDHEDFTGSKGTLNEGDLQFMTAGKGIVHAEMPAPGPDGETKIVEGIQLWVDLPKELKNCDPRYRDLRKDEIPVAESPNKDVVVKVISGESMGVDSVKDLAYTPVWYLDYNIDASKYDGRKLEQTMPHGFNVLLYVMKGGATVDGQVLKANDVAIFDTAGDGVEFRASETEDSRIIVVGGQILDQPIVQHGPFVSTTREGIMSAMIDYQSGNNGFERAPTWVSEIGKRMTGR